MARAQRPTTSRAPNRVIVADVMVQHPKTCPVGATVAELREMFADDHVHAVLVVLDGQLISVVERDDLQCADASAPAATYGRLAGRVVAAAADSDVVLQDMIDRGVRRLAVTDDAGMLLGLMCMKRSRTGFCSDADVGARAAERPAAG